MPAMATTPTTTPTAMPTVLGLLELLDALDALDVEAAGCPVAVTTKVLGGIDEVDVLVDPDELEVTDAGSRLRTLFLVTPVNSTHQRLSPPHVALS